MLKFTITGLLFLLLAIETNLPKITLEIVIALLMGLSVRFVFNWSRNTLTFKNCIERSVYACVLCYFVVYVWRDYKIASNIIYTIAIVAIISAEIVNEGIKLIEMGFKAYAKRWINNLIAKDDRI